MRLEALCPLNINYLNKLRESTGKWHDNILSIDLVSSGATGDSQAVKVYNQNTKLRKRIVAAQQVHSKFSQKHKTFLAERDIYYWRFLRTRRPLRDAQRNHHTAAAFVPQGTFCAPPAKIWNAPYQIRCNSSLIRLQ